MVDDSEVLPDVSSPDPDDNYLIALASKSRSALVSGDTDLLQLSDQIPVYSPTEFLGICRELESPHLIPGRAFDTSLQKPWSAPPYLTGS